MGRVVQSFKSLRLLRLYCVIMPRHSDVTGQWLRTRAGTAQMAHVIVMVLATCTLSACGASEVVSAQSATGDPASGESGPDASPAPGMQEGGLLARVGGVDAALQCRGANSGGMVSHTFGPAAFDSASSSPDDALEVHLKTAGGDYAGLKFSRISSAPTEVRFGGRSSAGLTRAVVVVSSDSSGHWLTSYASSC